MSRIRVCRIKSDTEVQSGLSMSPADIERLTYQGQSAALGSLEGNAYYDNLPNGVAAPFEEQRGVSINDVWRHSNAARSRIMSAREKIALEKAASVQDGKFN